MSEILQNFFDKKRSKLIVEIDLDPVPGWGNIPEDHMTFLQRYLNDAVGHYNPTVKIAPEE